MSVFADFVLEIGPHRREELPTRSGAWETVAENVAGRLRISRPADGQGATACARTRGRAAWVVGEIHRYDGREATTAECLRSFLSNDLRYAKSMAGRFAIVAWSDADREWSVFTDRVGAMHAYVAASGRVVSSFSAAAYRYSARRLDWRGLTGFFALGFFPGDRTYFEDCRVLRPASRYDLTSDGAVRSTRYWDWQYIPDTRRGEDDTIAEFGSRLRMAVAAQTRQGRGALPLSGGLDSRTVAACLPENSGLVAYGYGYRGDSEEIRIAAEVARAASLPFHSHSIRPYLFRDLGSVMNAVEGFQDVTQTRQASVAPWLRQNADFVLGAHWGDVLCDTMGLARDTSADDTVHKLESKMRKRGSQWLLEHLCEPNLGSDTREAVTENLRAELGRHREIADPDFLAKVVKTEQWAFRWTLPSIRMYEAGATPRLPFLDADVIDFFCTVPTELVRGRRLQIEFLKRHARPFAKVRWQAYDANLYRYQYFDTLQLPRRAWKRVARAFDRTPIAKRNWEVQLCAPTEREQLREAILAGDSLAREFVSEQRLRSLLDAFEASPDAANGYTVSMLLTFCAWGRHLGNREEPMVGSSREGRPIQAGSSGCW